MRGISKVFSIGISWKYTVQDWSLSPSGLFSLTCYQGYLGKTDRQKGKRTDREESWIPPLHTTLSRMSENSFCIAWRFEVITQLPKCRVLSPVKGVQRRKPTAKNRPKAKPKAFILYLDPGEQRWKFKEIRTTDFSSQASKNSPAAGVHWVGTRQPSLGASGGMCSHNLLRKAASDRSLPDLQGHGSFIMPPSHSTVIASRGRPGAANTCRESTKDDISEEMSKLV